MPDARKSTADSGGGVPPAGFEVAPDVEFMSILE
jgi:hypothetical protein